MNYEWRKVTLGEVAELVIDYRGKTPKKLGGDWSEKGYRALSAKNIKTGHLVQPDTIRFVDEVMYKKWMKDEIQRGDILITSEAPFGQIYFWDSDEKIVLSQRLFGVRIKKEYHPKFVYYYMITDEFQGEMDGRATGTTVVGLRQPELMKCELRCPDYKIQKRIAAILSAIDGKIAVNTKINDDLQQQLETLYRGTVKAATSELRIITLKELCNIFTGKKNANQFDEDGKYMFFTCGEKPLRINSYIYDGPAIIISGNGSYTGRTLFYNGRFDLYQRTYACTLKDGVPNDFIFGLFSILKIELHARIGGGTHGSSIPYIVMNDLANFEFSFNNAEFSDFSKKAKSFLSAIQHNQQQNEVLEQIRDSLLPKLMSGEIDVSGINW